MIDALNVMPVYDALKSKTGLDIRVSTMGVNISDSLHGFIKGYYGFYNTGAVRVDVNSEGDVVQICVWRKPGDLNSPDSKVDTSEADALSFINTVSDLMNGQMLESSFLESEDRLLFTEGAKDDVADFLSENPEALESKISHAYLQYDAWARENGRKQMSSVYFSNNLKALKASMDPITSSRGPRGVLSGSEDPEQTLVEPTEEDIFVNDIMNNEIYYKAAMYENVLRRMSKDDPGIVSLFVYGGPGLGKGSANSSLINTPKGRIPMGDLKVGDYITTPKGAASKILEVHPLGVQQIFQVGLSDGACAYVTEDHLWKVKRMDRTISRAQKKFGETLPRRWDLLTTKDLMEIGLRQEGTHGKWRFAIPYLEKPYEIEKPITPTLHPYLLGALLGDGGLSTKSGISFSSLDEEIVTKLREILVSYDCELIQNKDSLKDYRISSKGKENKINTLLKSLGLKEVKSFDKFLPSEFMNYSAGDRIQLLQGLMDTDGSCIKARGRRGVDFWAAQYYTVSPKLKEGVLELVRSLGGRCSVVKKSSRYKSADSGEIMQCQDHYRLTISFVNPEINPFYLSRKAKKYSPNKNTTRTIRDITPVFKEEATCILIDDPDHLYVADDYVVTHNTYTCKKILKEEGAWETKVTYKSGSIAGFTGLLQLLWDNRKGKIIVLDDNDSLLVGNIAAANILKAALNTDPEDRVISYTRFRR